MKARRRLSKKLILCAGIATPLLAAYLHFGLCPGKLKNIVSEKMGQATHKRIFFKKMLYLPFRGLAFDDLSVGDADGRTLFSAKQLAVDAKIFQFIRNKKIVIRKLFLDHPQYDFVMGIQSPPEPGAAPVMTRMSGQITVPVASNARKNVLENLNEGPDAFLPENVYIEQIHIVDGRVRVQRPDWAQPIEEIRSINIKMTFRRPPIISFEGSFDLGRDAYTTVRLNGGWNLDSASYEFLLDMNSRRIPEWLAEYQKKHLLSLEKGRSHVRVKLRSVGETLAVFDLDADLQESTLRLQKTFFDGLFSVDAKGLFNFDTHSFDRYQGRLKLTRVNVRNLSARIDNLYNVSASTRFQPDLLTIEQASGEYEKVPFLLAGQIKSFKEPHVTARIEVDSSIEEIVGALAAEQKKFMRSFELGGTCHTVTAVQGALKPGVPLTMDYKIVVNKGFIRNEERKINISDLFAEIFMDASGLRVIRSDFVKDRIPYSLDGFLPKDPKTTGTLKLSSKDMSLWANYLSDGQNAQIEDGNVDYAGVHAKFKGKLINIFDPYLDIDGDATVLLETLAAALTPQSPWLKNAGVKGTLQGYYQLKGQLSHPLDWDLKMDASSDSVFINKNLRLGDFSMQVRMKNRILNIPYVHTESYGGKTTGSILFDLKPAKPTFDAKLGSSNLDIKLLARDLDVQNKDLAGTALFNVVLRGVVGAPETVRGSGSMDIQNGMIFKTAEFKKMGELPFVRVEGLDSVTFTSLSSVFSTRDRKIWTDNLQLRSDTVNLSLHGTIGFDQTLDMLMDVHYSNDVFRGAADAGGLAPFMVQKAEGMISQYKLTGPLKSPKSEKIP